MLAMRYTKPISGFLSSAPTRLKKKKVSTVRGVERVVLQSSYCGADLTLLPYYVIYLAHLLSNVVKMFIPVIHRSEAIGLGAYRCGTKLSYAVPS
jgi:hypothetical protein